MRPRLDPRKAHAAMPATDTSASIVAENVEEQRDWPQGKRALGFHQERRGCRKHKRGGGKDDEGPRKLCTFRPFVTFSWGQRLDPSNGRGPRGGNAIGMELAGHSLRFSCTFLIRGRMRTRIFFCEVHIPLSYIGPFSLFSFLLAQE